HQARDQYRHGERLRPWLFAIAARVRSDEYRRNGRVSADTEDCVNEDDPRVPVIGDGSESAAVEQAEVVTRVRQALDRLPESQRVIVHMHRYAGLTFPEIGQALGLSSGAVKLRAFRAYEQLRKQLRPILDGGSS